MSDPTISLHDSDDPSSRALKKGLGLIFWPGAGLLALGLITAFVFMLPWLARLMTWYAALWLAAHVMFRPSKFGAEIAACLLALRDVFAGASAFLANWLKTNVRATASKQSKAAQPPLTLYNVAPAAEAPPESAPPPLATKRWDVDWGRLGAALLNPRIWLLLATGWVALIIANGLNLFSRSGREVAAEAERNIAIAETKTREAELRQRESALARSDALESRRGAIHQQSEAARAALETSPDDDARFAAYVEFTQRLRDDSAHAAAAAVSDYHSSLRS